MEIQKLMKEFEIAPNSAVAAIHKIRIELLESSIKINQPRNGT
ncbi:hypothetical protein bthur0011_22140 [Bacillus thuringiensis serovar huazhongensis BGSC 4BD1]|nr:hypothetical protein bthur0011_22140 [Bacillus thuringiensis serovar huazhongensis BGSC 4BD1]KLA25602.1 hypothetical protein B4080_2242 [Bacillus cereus]